MKIYGVEFKITEWCVDKQKIEVISGEGVVIPLALNKIGGFYDYLVRNRCVRKDRINMIYIFSIKNCGEMLCVKYLNGEVSVIQDIGRIDFLQKLIT